MRKFIIISVLVGCLVSCRKDPKPSVCYNCIENITSQSTDYFLEDAEDLAYREIFEDSSHIGFNQVELEPNTVNCYLGKLSAIFSASQSSSGSFYNMLTSYKVHQGPRMVLNGMTIEFIDSSSLRTELVDNPGNTSNPFLNQLYNDYSFVPYTQFWGDNIYIEASEGYNIRYIKQELLQSSEIVQVYLNLYFLDGPSIEYIPYPDYDIFIFGYGWGDCPSGCMAKHFWKIKVDGNCNAALIEEYGNELPE